MLSGFWGARGTVPERDSEGYFIVGTGSVSLRERREHVLLTKASRRERGKGPEMGFQPGCPKPGEPSRPLLEFLPLGERGRGGSRGWGCRRSARKGLSPGIARKVVIAIPLPPQV